MSHSDTGCFEDMTDSGITDQKVTNTDKGADSEEIPEYTVVPLTHDKIKKINAERYASKRVINLYISHLLDVNKVTRDDKLEKHFRFNNMTFRTIMLRGIITELQFLRFKTKNRVLISVDDGTAVLDCYVEPNNFMEEVRYDVCNKLKDARDLSVLQPNNNLLKATCMMLQSSQERLKKLPCFNDFKRGDTVKLIGSLSEYNNKRSCFISNIIKVSTDGNTNYLEDLDNLYQTVYL